MKTEKEKMLSGELYDASDSQLVAERQRAQELCYQLNHLSPEKPAQERRDIIHQLIGADTNIQITPPFYCDYGTNITVGNNVYFNFNGVVLDVAEVRIGNDVMFGPNVQILTATHPIDATERRSGLESGKPIVIGNDVWVGGGAIICPNVTIGDGVIIGAGSVVTQNIPSNTIAVGNPCRVIKEI